MTLEALVLLLSACLWLHTLARIQQDSRIRRLEQRVKDLEQWESEAETGARGDDEIAWSEVRGRSGQQVRGE